MGRALTPWLKGLALPTLLLALLLAACGPTKTTAPPGTVWVEYLETQCLTNPWEQEWLSRTGKPPEAFPQDEGARLAIFQDYYQARGLTIHEAKRIQYMKPGELTCLACSCPNGYKVQALIDAAELEQALSLGFRKAP